METRVRSRWSEKVAAFLLVADANAGGTGGGRACFLCGCECWGGGEDGEG